MKLYQVQFENYLEKTYYVVERDPEKALIRAFTRAANDVLTMEPTVLVYPPPGRLGASEVRELCDAKDLILDILDALDEKEPDMVVGIDRASGDSFSVVQEYQSKQENSDKVVDAGSR